ncbi:MAG: molybdenum cofactor biosynthesis protein MoaE [Deltaproteobacteria bacterium]|nr:molybdenum cofactor biosynthesis protein MoaE [Deltaproteobacteria bacterium]
MDLNRMIATLRKHPDSRKIGMIASHLGVVRGSSRDGRPVEAMDVVVDHGRVEKILEEVRVLPGIVDVLVDFNEGHLKVGEEILAVAVAGDIRENVFDALMRTVKRIKAEASRKEELYL